MRKAMRPLLLLGLLLPAPQAAAQTLSQAQRQEVVGILRDALRSDPTILRDALSALQADDARKQDQVTQDVLRLLAPKLTDPADPVAGNPLGDVTLVEFYDTRCPYCRRMKPVLADLLRQDPGIKLVVKDLPVLGNTSQLESRALLAVQRQGGYFKLQAAIMAGAASSTRDTLRAEADRLGLDGGRMLRDMDDTAIKDRLSANLDLAKQIGIEGTPAFVLGTRLIPGAVELADLQKAVAEARNQRK